MLFHIISDLRSDIGISGKAKQRSHLLTC